MSTAVVSVCPMGQRSPSLLARWACFTRANESASRHGMVGVPSWAMVPAHPQAEGPLEPPGDMP